MTGPGVCTFANGDRYVGSLSQGQLSGQGTYTFVTGTSISGTWRDGRFLSTPTRPGGGLP
jgi:hypothetical protein